VADREDHAASPAASIISSASSSDAPSASRRAPARRPRNGSAMLAVQLGRHGDGHGVDLSEQLAAVEQRRVAMAAAISSARARLVSTTATSSTPAATQRIRA
jgi:hypothetical protein